MTTRDITIRLRGDPSRAQAALRSVSQQASRTANDMQRRFQGAAQRINAAFRSIRGPAIAITAAAGAFGVMAQRSLAAAESIADTARQANIATERLQELRFAADQNGSSAQAMDQALRVLRSNMGLVAQGAGGEAARALRTLGLEQEVLTGQLSDTGQAFDLIVRRLEGIESPAQRAAVATQLLGRGGRELTQLLDGGSEAIDRASARLREMGGVLDDELVQNGARANAEIRAMRQAIGTQFNRAVLENANELRAFAQALADIARFGMDAAAAITRVGQAFGLGRVGGTDERTAQILRGVEGQIESGQFAGQRLTRGGPLGIVTEFGNEVRTALIQALGQREGMAEFERIRRETGGDLDSVARELARIAMQFEAAAEAQTAPPGQLGSIEPLDPQSVTTAIERGVTDAQPVLRDKYAAAMKDADRQRIEDAENKARELERFRSIAKEASQQMAQELEFQQSRMAQTFGDAMAGGIMAAFDGDLRSFIANSFRRAAFEGLSNAFANLFRQSGGGLFGAIGGIFGLGMGGSVPGKRATGGPASGLTLVGEQGPELVNLGPMANVMTANMTRAAMNASKSTRQNVQASVNSSINIDARGAGEGVEERIRAVLSVEGPRLQRQTVEATMQVLAGINANRVPA